VTPDSTPAKPASQAEEVTPDSGGESASGSNAKTELKPGRSPSASACEPYVEAIEVGLAKGRNAKAIWQDLVDTYGFTGAYQSAKRFIRKFRGEQAPEACAVIETAPGEELQVDYGSGPMVRDVQSGKYRRTRLFVLTLGYSRKSVRLMVFGSSSQTWAELHETAFRRLGGVTRVAVLDNLREGVLKPDIYDPTVNPLYRDMLRHYNVVALPCRIRDPDRKAYVSYCTSSRPCNGEDGLLGPAASMALENRALIQRFVQATAGVVVTMLLQSALSSPKIDCSGGHSVAHAHLFGGEQSLGP
jgi:transposase